MQIIIDLQEELYKAYKGRPPMLGDAGMDMIAQSIANGTVLSKGHGRLIDVDEVEAILHNKAFDMVESNAKFYTIRWVQKIVRNAPTIIEADRGGRQ